MQFQVVFRGYLMLVYVLEVQDTGRYTILLIVAEISLGKGEWRDKTKKKKARNSIHLNLSKHMLI